MFILINLHNKISKLFKFINVFIIKIKIKHFSWILDFLSSTGQNLKSFPLLNIVFFTNYYS